MVPMVFLPILGLVTDAGVLFDARRELQQLADGAARVGAMEIDADELRTGVGRVVIDDAEARRAVRDYLNERVDFNGPRDIDTSGNRVRVTLSRQVHTRFLSLFGIRSVRIEALGRAVPCSGTTQATVRCG
jgi:hypothetical protein